MTSVGEIVLPDILDENVQAAKAYLEDAAKTSSLEGEEKSYQVVVMATHGLGGPQLWAMGNTTEHVLQTARQSLLIVRR